MKPPHASSLRILLLSLLVCAARAEDAPPAQAPDHGQLVSRLRNLEAKENAFGPQYQAIYHAMLPWYETWGSRDTKAVDSFMTPPDVYARALADALETGHNFVAENPGAQLPLVFKKTLPDGRKFVANYWLSVPSGFPAPGRTFPLFIGLHGSGWLSHKISFTKGSGTGGPAFSVTPIDMDGPWKIDFLNAYLDELEAILPIDRDRIYVEGHSLGGMATWEWALDNPERFAAISPEAGIGEPYRASRLKNVPSWAIHGQDDDVIPYGFAEQMVSALQSEGAPVRLSILKGGAHNMPADLDHAQVVAWYLKQTRSHLPVPADPRDALGLDSSGFSPVEIVTLPDWAGWSSPPLATLESMRGAAKGLFQRVHDRGEAVDSPLMWEMDPLTRAGPMWLAVPKVLHNAGPADPNVKQMHGGQFARFYGKGRIAGALDHLQAIKSSLVGIGHSPTGNLWYTPLSVWQDTPGAIYECRIQVN